MFRRKKPKPQINTTPQKMSRIKLMAKKLQVVFSPRTIESYTPQPTELLAELATLQQPIEICYSHTKKPQALIDLSADKQKLTFDRRGASSFYIDKKKTDEDHVQLFGAFSDHTMWYLTIERGRSRKAVLYRATFQVGKRVYTDRVIKASDKDKSL